MTEKCKPCEIYRGMCMKKHVLIKNAYKLIKHGFITTKFSRKESAGCGYTSTSLVKIKFQVSKKDHIESFF